MVGQSTLPGTEAVIGNYDCGHGRTHRVPSEGVTVFKQFSGFTAVCSCGTGPIDPDEPPRLGLHTTLIGGASLDADLWLALDEETSEWFPGSEPDQEPVGGGQTVGERRAACRERMEKTHNGEEML